MIARRLMTVPAYLLTTVAVTLSLPLLLPVALILSFVPATRGAVPTLLFLSGYLWCETIGIVAAGYLRLRHRRVEPFLAANYRLQEWWATALLRLAKRLFRLRIDVQGGRALEGPPAIVLPRHASIADTVVPLVLYALPRGYRLRYVLKRELLLDPCLDIVGNRLPNYFVDRGGVDSDEARHGVASLARGLGVDEGVVIYPEGTRATPRRREALLRRYADTPDVLEQLRRWPGLLPPRLGGTMALLSANPGRDLLFCAHTGFEACSHFINLLGGGWSHAEVRIRFWRVPFHDVPRETGQLRSFLFQQWDRMAREIQRLQDG